MVIFAVLAAVGGPRPATAQPPFNVGEARKSVVFVKRITPGLGPAVGSGFLVSADGLIYTNRHVALPRDESIRGTLLLVGVPSAKDPDVLEYYRAEPVYAPPQAEGLDFAVLKIAAPKGAGFRPLPISFDKVGLGGDVAVLGYPYVQENQPNLSFNKGSISATRVLIGERPYYQTDAAVNPGNSGGPLVNAKGEAVGMVTKKKGDASNIGFALYMSEVKAAADEARKQAAAVNPEPGPLDPKGLPVVAAIAPKKANWKVNEGTLKEGPGVLVIDNDGGTFALTSKEPLPEDFQLVIQCHVEFLQGRQRLQPSQRSILRSVCVRFATPETDSRILEPKGYLFRFSHEMLLLSKEGAKEAVKVVRKGNGDAPFVLVVTKQGADYSLAVDGEVLMRYHDDKPLKGGERFSIGGYLARLYVGEVSVIKLDPVPAKR